MNVQSSISQGTWRVSARLHASHSEKPKDAADLGVVRRVILNNPVDFGNIQPSSCHVRAQQYPRVRIAELEECGRALVLLLPSLESNQNIH